MIISHGPAIHAGKREDLLAMTIVLASASQSSSKIVIESHGKLDIVEPLTRADLRKRIFPLAASDYWTMS